MRRVSLSAMGSSRAPKEEVKLNWRAKFPSIKSVRREKTKRIKPSMKKFFSRSIQTG